MEQLLSIFDVKYSEFTTNLLEAIPEMNAQILAAAALSPAERLDRFKSEVLPNVTPTKISRTILPGVTLTDDIWESLGEEGQKAIREFLSVLGVCCMSDSEEWSKEFLNKWKESMASVDFDNLAAKMASIFGAKGENLPKIPERLLKGQLAKLAEELVKEFTPEDFGMNTAEMSAAGDNPMRAFELLSKVFTERPEIMQNAMKRIAKRLQEKVQRGELRPQEMAKEAEELMKEFTDNPEMVSLMESFRGMFGFEDKEAARAVGRDGENRLSIVQARLRKKLEEKKKQRAGK